MQSHCLASQECGTRLKALERRGAGLREEVGMKKLFGSNANQGSVVARVTQQTMQYAGKAEKTEDDDYKLLSAQFKECSARAATSEKILQLHYDAVLGIMGALEGITS